MTYIRNTLIALSMLTIGLMLAPALAQTDPNGDGCFEPAEITALMASQGDTLRVFEGDAFVAFAAAAAVEVGIPGGHVMSVGVLTNEDGTAPADTAFIFFTNTQVEGLACLNPNPIPLSAEIMAAAFDAAVEAEATDKGDA